MSDDVAGSREPTRDSDLVERSRSAAKVLAANAELTERERRPAAESIDAVRTAGLFGLTVPRSAGGLEASARSQVEALTELGQGCASTAWVTALTLGAKAVALDVLPDGARNLLLGDPAAILCGSGASSEVSATRVPEGLLVSGRWRFVSGCEASTWAFLIVPLIEDGVPVMICPALIPVSDLSVERTWQMAGMAGTGSHTLVVDNVLVPADQVRFASLVDGAAPDFRPSPLTMTEGAAAMLAPMVGAVMAACQLVESVLAGDKAPYGSRYRRIADSTLARYWFTQARHRVDSALRQLLLVADTVDEARATTGQLDLAERARLRTHLTTSAAECREAMERLLDLNGMSGFALDSPLQRIWRDVAIGTRHPQFNPYLAEEDYGRVLLHAGDTMSVML